MNKLGFRVITLSTLIALSTSVFSAEEDVVEDHNTNFRDTLLNGPNKDLESAHEDAKKAKTVQQAVDAHNKAAKASLEAAELHKKAAEELQKGSNN